MPDPAVQGGRGVQGRRAEHRAQRGDLPRRAQQDGRLREADVPRLRHRPDRDGHLQGLLQVPKSTLKLLENYVKNFNRLGAMTVQSFSKQIT